MKGIIRNRKVVAEALLHTYGRRGLPPSPTPHDRVPPSAVFKRQEVDGQMLFLPHNVPALKYFNSLSEDERIQLATSEAPKCDGAGTECESKRILAGSRFKALPRGKREGDVFVGDSVRPIYPSTTGSLARVSSLHSWRRIVESKASYPDAVARLMTEYNLNLAEALEAWRMIQNGKPDDT